MEAVITPPAEQSRGDWRLAGQALLGFWALHLLYRAILAAFEGQPNQLFDPALLVALPFGFLLSVGLCVVLKALLPRGLAFGLGLTALLSLPVSLIYASVELALFFQLSPALNQPSSTQTLPDGTVVTANASGSVTYRQRNGRRATVKLPPIRQRALAMAPRTIATNTTGWYFFYFGLGALFIGLASGERLRRAERAATEYQRLAHASQLRALRY